MIKPTESVTARLQPTQQQAKYQYQSEAKAGPASPEEES